MNVAYGDKKCLTIALLKDAAASFSAAESETKIKQLYGVTDGKAVGTFIEHKFQDFLQSAYLYSRGNSASGIDLPDLAVDIKTTSITQPQSSCPFKSARQKVYGLGYSLLVFVYEKIDERRTHSACLKIRHVVFVDAERTADFQTTSALLEILDRHGNEDDVSAFILDRHLPVDEIQAVQLAKEILNCRPKIGYLTISNALQWRLQYQRVIDQAGTVDGVDKVL